MPAKKRHYAFALLPVLAAIELVAHAVEVRGVVPDADYQAAAREVGSKAKPEDLVVFAPGWSDPVGRQHFGALVTAERAGFTDLTRFPRAFEVAQGGGRRPELDWFTVESETKVGALTVRTLKNPTYEPVIDDLLDHVAPQKMIVQVRRGGRDTDCPFVAGAATAGPWGPATPARRFQCPHGPVGVITMPDVAYSSRHCLYAPLPEPSSHLRVQFLDVKFGKKLRFSHGLHVEGERYQKGAPVEIAMSVPVETKSEGEHEKVYGRAVHKDGDGWARLDVDTAELAGNTGDLVFDLHAGNPQDRLYCFAGTTR